MKKLKLREFVLQRQKEGASLSPTDLMDAYNALPLKKKVTLQAVSQLLKRMSLGASERTKIVVENARLEAGKDIEDYDEVKAYVSNSQIHRTMARTVKRTLKNLRATWELMGKTSPYTWNSVNLIEALKKKYPTVTNAQGALTFTSPSQVQKHLGAVNTMFPGKLPKGFSKGFNRAKGELVDAMTFAEFDSFINALTGYNVGGMSDNGWKALFTAQVSISSREGSTLTTGILSLRWEDINFETKRCKLREKGGHGFAGRIWVNLPIGGQVFPWLKTWDYLTKWRILWNASSGRVFPVSYEDYRDAFKHARIKAGGRISQSLETMTPHILRKTSAQWKRKLRYPLQVIAGAFPNGYLGVGWDNINILKDFYTSIEPDEYAEAEEKANGRMKALGLWGEAK